MVLGILAGIFVLSCLALLVLPDSLTVATIANGTPVLIGMILLIFADGLGSQFSATALRLDKKTGVKLAILNAVQTA